MSGMIKWLEKLLIANKNKKESRTMKNKLYQIWFFNVTKNPNN